MAQDTFYITEEILLLDPYLTSTGAGDAHDLKDDLSRACRDTDATTATTPSNEGLVVGKNISMADLQGTLQLM